MSISPTPGATASSHTIYDAPFITPPAPSFDREYAAGWEPEDELVFGRGVVTVDSLEARQEWAFGALDRLTVEEELDALHPDDPDLVQMRASRRVRVYGF
jgi:hypothetical protein